MDGALQHRDGGVDDNIHINSTCCCGADMEKARHQITGNGLSLVQCWPDGLTVQSGFG